MISARWVAVCVVAALVAGCTTPVAYAPEPVPVVVDAGSTLSGPAAMAAFRQVASQIEPIAESMCRTEGNAANCDFRIVIDDRPNQPPNAFQTLDNFGRPILAFSVALIADARNVDELAFVIGHEAAHHIAGHIPQARQSALQGALIAGILAEAAGGGRAEIEAAQRTGATVAARSYSKEFELEADALGAEIAFHAGFDPLRGADFFDRLPDPGDQFLGTHPTNAARKAAVARVVARLRGY
ncbi:MAG: peptidase M48 [Rhodobacterales bacterium RIFCSPHIGHO2_02_FULL_62_130]|nr:MAG: peptidase M48 [Rhodobacterales bacterium RIFCSPHIGHO2_02_FULL_62_130]OHC57170.1 MAG: peptidase M48 [Rhodobacterales bacterium RIFCSPHIGHO2_12_FULL_62_75]HCY98966.1 peptidase M48 [Rhodobacter sp.]